MPRFDLTGPDGKEYWTEGPEGSTRDDALRLAPQLLSEGKLHLKEAAVSPSSAPMSWSDVGMGAIKNLGPSALQFGSDIVQPIIHPIETAKGIGNIGLGVGEKLFGGFSDPTAEKPEPPAVGEHEKYADAVGKFFADRYGGMEALKKTMATDPIGFLSDLSTVVTGGGTLAARAPGALGKAAEVARIAGRSIDPINAAAQTAALAGRGASGLIGYGTHTGGESIRTAAKAGYEGGEGASTFRENIKGVAPTQETVDAARAAVENIKRQRGEAYRAEMARINADTTILDFAKIDTAIRRAEQIKTYKGQSISPTTEKIRGAMIDEIEAWRKLDPKEFHTAEGIDALKQKLGDIKDATTPGTPEHRAATEIYRAVRQTIVDQVPRYAKAMRGYEEASDLIRTLERELSLGNKANVDTALRKLQSVLRNNVSTAYGRRKELAQYLIDAGAPHLMERLAGQALQPPFPRGFGRLASQIGTELVLIAAGHAATGGGSLLALAPAVGVAPFMSPRLMGEAAYYAGRAASPTKYMPRGVPQSLYQLGRAASVSEEEKQAARRRAMQGILRGALP